MPIYKDSNGINMCPHCRCKAGKENRPVEYIIYQKSIHTNKFIKIGEACGICATNYGYHESTYSED